MGFLDIDADDPLVRMFDRNEDGVLDLLEHSEMWDYMEDASEIDGISREDLEQMEEDERREYLEREGYDEDDFEI